MKIVVLGDAILDVYINVAKVQMSPEAPVLDSFIKNKWEFKHGGAANVAENLKALGCEEVMMIGVVDDDFWGDTLAKLKTDVDCHLIKVENLLTTTKIRLMDGPHQIHRVSYEEPKPLIVNAVDEVCRLIPKGEDWKFVLVDYNKGFWQGDVSPIMEAIGNRHFCAMPKPENVGTFKGAVTLSLNNKEFSLLLELTKSVLILPPQKFRNGCEIKTKKDVPGGRRCNETLPRCHRSQRARPSASHREGVSIQEKGDVLSNGFKSAPELFCNEMNICSLMVTRGGDGLDIYTPPFFRSRRIPAHRVEVADVCGAGDTTAAVFFYFLYKNYSVIDAATIANHAGSLAVQKRGCVTLSHSEVAGVANMRR